MQVIDDEGQLFGTVNIVDALAVLLVLAVGLAGVALVAAGDPAPMETRYVTVDFGTQPEFLVEQVDVGDTDALKDQAGNLTITDTYLTTAETGTHVVARVAVSQRVSEGGAFVVRGERLRLGRTLDFQNESYALNGTIRDVGNETTLPTGERSVVLRGSVPNAVADDVAAGDEIRVAGSRIATIENATAYDAERQGSRTLFLSVRLRTYSTGDAVRFGGTRVESGRRLSLPVAGYQFNGTVERVGGGLDRTTEEVLVTTEVTAETAAEIERGDSYRIAGQSLATVENVAAYGTDNPERKRVYLGLSVQALGYGERPLFGSQTIREGGSLPFRTQAYEFNGSILRRGTTDLQVFTQEVLVTSVVDVSVAQELNESDAYRVAGQPIATIENVAVYGTGNPDRKRVYVGLSVQALGYGEVPQFGAGRPLRKGVTLPFRTPAYRFGGEIVRLGALNQPGQSTERTVTLEMQNVPPERANSVRAGLTETNAGQTIARVTDVQVQPAVITLTSESGQIYEREHPVNKDVTLTVELRVRELDTGVRFKGRILQEGNQVTLDLGTTTVTATVADLDGT